MKRGLSILFALLAAICLGGAAEARPCYKAITNSILELGVLLSSAPQVELLEAGTSPSVQAVWKLYGPDLNGRYGGLNGAGGLEGVSPYQNVFNPLLSDARGNVLAEVTNGVAAWTLARPTGYGAVPGYRPVAYGNGVDLAQSCVFRGREVDVTGYYHFGLRDYDPVSGQWLSYDPAWNDRDPNGQSYCGGDPINRFDADGRMGKYLGPDPWEQFQQQTDDYLQSQYGELPGYALGQQSGSQTFSSLLNIIPLVGGLKMWVELNTGLDLVTGQRIQTGDWTQAAMIGLNILPLALEAAPEEAALEAEVNMPFYRVGQVEWEGTAGAADEGYAIGARLPGGGIAGDGPGAALGNGPDFAAEDTVTLYHGTTTSAARNILSGGFRAAEDNAVFFGEDFSTASFFGETAVAERSANSGQVLRYTLPQSLAENLGLTERQVLGEFRGAPPIDIPGGSGFERILTGDQISLFNQAVQSGRISVKPFRIAP